MVRVISYAVNAKRGIGIWVMKSAASGDTEERRGTRALYMWLRVEQRDQPEGVSRWMPSDRFDAMAEEEASHRVVENSPSSKSHPVLLLGWKLISPVVGGRLSATKEPQSFSHLNRGGEKLQHIMILPVPHVSDAQKLSADHIERRVVVSLSSPQMLCLVAELVSVLVGFYVDGCVHLLGRGSAAGVADDRSPNFYSHSPSTGGR